ncbi:MAG TPA: bifunctional shikimate kinase/3-dehydroquinate synthase [Solirubrobacterales bacterium]|nr:bifunctional shikimate kinase/3-dehydroquinate synthase [Solirubrobacterales bacterium]
MARPAIVFIGFMGAGKSTALAAARHAGLETTEIDELMAESFGMPITEAFEQHGEEGFREREAEIVGSLLEEADGGVIALGGGSILSDRIRRALVRHIVVWLQVGAAEAWRRIAHSSRPLATSAADVEQLLAARLPLYEELADAIVPVGDRDIVERALPAIQSLSDLPAGTKLIWASSASGEYPIYVGPGLLSAVSEGWWPVEGRRFCVGDTTTMGLYADRLEPLSARIEVDPGEFSKSFETTEKVIEALVDTGMNRQDHIVALGGGVVGDLAGFCAHIYQRGVPVVQVPTTLVAQVDSAYGGKTGIDLVAIKNYVGAYQLPAAVLADVKCLETLSLPELRSGFVEVLKTGLLAGGALWERVRLIEDLDPPELTDIVLSCARYKCEVVAADEQDSGWRNVLNLGHTIGHAIEAGTIEQGMRHGEAVGIGLLGALRLSDAPDLRSEVESILVRHQLPTEVRFHPDERDIRVDELLRTIQLDKKRTAAGVGFVLLSEPGEPRVGQLVDPGKVRAAVEELVP